MSIFDDGRTGWLDALRVHPSVRGRGLATHTQNGIIEKGKLLYPRIEHFRSCTTFLNKASQAVFAKCGMKPVYRQGLILVSQTRAESSEFECLKMSHTEYKAKLSAIVTKVENASGRKWNPNIANCDIDAVLKFEENCGESDISKFCLNFDWKMALFNRESLEKFLSYPEKPQLAVLQRAASEGPSAWVIGMKRTDGYRTCTVVTDSRHDSSDRFRDLLALLMLEVDAAIRDKAYTFRTFFDIVNVHFLCSKTFICCNKQHIVVMVFAFSSFVM